MSSSDKHDHDDVKSSMDHDKIERAARFWSHPMLQSVAPNDKMEYLRQRVGLSTNEIHAVWERATAIADEQQPTATEMAGLNHRHIAAPNHEEEESPFQVPALLAVGAAFGLTAAAAVRWLNGGDFYWFPPASSNTINEDQENSQILKQNDNYQEAEATEEDEDEKQAENDAFLLLRQDVQELSSLVRSQQDRILEQIRGNMLSKDVTDQSMALLRRTNHNNETGDDVRTILLDIRKILTERNDDENDDLKSTLLRLNQVLDKVQDNDITTLDQKRDNGEHVNHDEKEEAHGGDDNNEGVRIALRVLKEQNESDALQRGLPMLCLYVSHLSKHPHVPRYRKIHTNHNTRFQTCVEPLQGATDLLQAIGFRKTDTCWEWNNTCWERKDNDEKKTYLLMLLQNTARALEILQTGTLEDALHQLDRTDDDDDDSP